MLEQNFIYFRWRILLERMMLIAAVAAVMPIFATAQTQSNPNSSTASLPAQTQTSNQESLHLKLFADEVRTIDLGIKINSIIILSPPVVSATIVGETSIRIGCQTLGQTTIIVIGANLRTAIVVDVVSHPSASDEEFNYLARRTKDKTFGTYTIGFSPPNSNSPAVFQQFFSLRRKLSETKTFRADVDFYNFTGRGNSLLYSPNNSFLNLNRIEVGLTEKDYLMDFLDSNVNLSRAELDNYTIRGFHYRKIEEGEFNENRSRLEVFGGLARPIYRFFDRSVGGIAGAMVPLADSPRFILRGGITTIITKNDTANFMRVDGKFEQSSQDRYQFAAASDGKDFSLYGRAAKKVKDFTFNAEAIKVADNSAFITIGAQGSGRREFNGSVYWQPRKPYSAFISTDINRLSSFAFSPQSGSLDLNSVLANFNYTPNIRTRFGFGFVAQKIRVNNSFNSNSIVSLFSNSVDTKGVSFTYSQAFGRSFNNNFSIRPTFSRDLQTNQKINNDLFIQEELTRSWARFSTSAFVNLNRRSTSLEAFINNNPNILPASLRDEYNRDPVQFFITYRYLLSTLTANLPLTFTGNLETGLRTQGSLPNQNFFAELRYLKSNFFGRTQNNLLASGSYLYRLDDFNQIGVNASRLISNTPDIRSANFITLNYTYRFGGGANRFSPLKILGINKLFGISESEINGRVFRDFNGNSLIESNEIGLQGVQIMLDNDKTVVTDAQGNYSFQKVSYGLHQVSIKSDVIGVSARLTTPQTQSVYIENRAPTTVNFGFYDRGFIAGRIFNDFRLNGSEMNAPGLPNVRVNLFSVDQNGVRDNQQTISRLTNGEGRYEFYSLPIGRYSLEVDPATLPPDFRIPQKTVQEIMVEPLKGNYFNIPVIAQRAVSGTISVDLNGRGSYQNVAGVRIIARSQMLDNNNQPLIIESVSGVNGNFILRNLPAGIFEIQALAANGKLSQKVVVELPIEPFTKRDLNLVIPFK